MMWEIRYKHWLWHYKNPDIPCVTYVGEYISGHFHGDRCVCEEEIPKQILFAVNVMKLR